MYRPSGDASPRYGHGDGGYRGRGGRGGRGRGGGGSGGGGRIKFHTITDLEEFKGEHPDFSDDSVLSTTARLQRWFDKCHPELVIPENLSELTVDFHAPTCSCRAKWGVYNNTIPEGSPYCTDGTVVLQKDASQLEFAREFVPRLCVLRTRGVVLPTPHAIAAHQLAVLGDMFFVSDAVASAVESGVAGMRRDSLAALQWESVVRSAAATPTFIKRFRSAGCVGKLPGLQNCVLAAFGGSNVAKVVRASPMFVAAEELDPAQPPLRAYVMDTADVLLALPVTELLKRKDDWMDTLKALYLGQVGSPPKAGATYQENWSLSELQPALLERTLDRNRDAHLLVCAKWWDISHKNQRNVVEFYLPGGRRRLGEHELTAALRQWCQEVGYLWRSDYPVPTKVDDEKKQTYVMDISSLSTAVPSAPAATSKAATTGISTAASGAEGGK